MKINFDQQADAIYIKFGSGKVAKTLEIEEDLYVDLDRKGKYLGIEILDASRKIPTKEFSKINNQKLSISSVR